MSDVTHQEESPVVATGRRTRGRLQSVRRAVDAGGLRMSLLDWTGPEQPLNPPTVILHGALQTAEGMANLASHLARRGRVVVPDLRGRGDTAQPEEGYDPGTMAADVAAMIASLGLDRPVVIGRLHGGLVAYHLAAEHPESLSGLIIGDTPPEVTDGRARQLIEATRSLPRSFSTLEDAYAFYQHVLGLPVERALHDVPFDLRRSSAGYTWRHNLDLVARIEEAALPRSDWDVLAKIQVPTLILRGQRGMLSPDTAARMCEQIGGCAVQTILVSGRDVFLGGGAEQAFSAIDLFLLRLTDSGPAHTVPGRKDDHARAFIEPLVRALNGKDPAALRGMLADDVAVEMIWDQQPVQTGDGGMADALIADLIEHHPTVVFAVERFLASRREASVMLVARSAPAGKRDSTKAEVSLCLSLWFDIAGEAIQTVRLQISRIAA